MVISCTRPAKGRCGARRRIIPFLLSGLLTATAIPPVQAQSTALDQIAAVHPHGTHIAEASERFGIPEAWIMAVMRAESAGDMRAISSAGAMGLMQVMPDTWAMLRIRYGLGQDPYDPRDNILAGTAYLREMWNRYGNVAAMLAAYNAGPGRYDEYLSTARLLPAETRAYVAALTPILLGERPSGGGTTVVSPPDWREAALFAGAGIGAAAADPSSPDRAPEDAASLVPARSEGLTDLRSEGLFVARHAGEDRP